MSRLAVTLGAGRKVAKGTVSFLPNDVPPAVALARQLESADGDKESWWSPHVWQNGHRGAERWVAAGCLGVDLDYHDEHDKHVTPPPLIAQSLEEHARAGHIPGSLFHHTPRGARVVFVFTKMVENREAMQRVAGELGRRVSEALSACGITGYRVDEKVLLDLGRLLFSPHATVNGERRDAEVVVMRADGYVPNDVAPQERVFRVVTAATTSIQDAIGRYNAENKRDLPRNSGDCPMCGHKGCFGSVPNTDPPRWACFSEAHAKGGKRSSNCWTGDFLDLDAHAAGVDPIEHLKVRGYLERGDEKAPPAPVTPIKPPDADGVLRSGSYASIVRVLRDPNLRDMVLGRGVLEFNEQTLRVTFNRRPLDENELSRIRELCETNLCPPSNKGKGLKFGKDQIQDAVYQVARERPFHPIKDYLRGLQWDGVQRLDHVAQDILNVNSNEQPLAAIMVRKWFIGAVARIMQPGCKMDTMLLFHGPPGIGKSTFFNTLAGDDWFCDTPMPIGEKDGYLMLHGTWVYEWAELDAVQRSKSPEVVKAFLSSRADHFRAPYAREMVPHPRQCVIVATVNVDDFLTDVTGNRRYWIVDLKDTLNIPLLTGMRDRLWAEAVAAYNAEEPWHLTGDEERALTKVHESHMKHDPWEERVRGYILAQADKGVLISGVLRDGLEKPAGQWTRSDEMRISNVLKLMGFARRRVTNAEGDREWRYMPVGDAWSSCRWCRRWSDGVCGRTRQSRDGSMRSCAEKLAR